MRVICFTKVQVPSASGLPEEQLHRPGLARPTDQVHVPRDGLLCDLHSAKQEHGLDVGTGRAAGGDGGEDVADQGAALELGDDDARDARGQAAAPEAGEFAGLGVGDLQFGGDRRVPPSGVMLYRVLRHVRPALDVNVDAALVERRAAGSSEPRDFLPADIGAEALLEKQPRVDCARDVAAAVVEAAAAHVAQYLEVAEA